ncbi:lysylphosphatidylglycerol synthase transmembrane domain-containing protein [Candidatus Leptofilum sp.]|uniref:lysylphosphatidylglycerol synthase transmembrane domain-containing protein n=1 Tax=Candidatus Leptofilum sp. TaxID=3241576 RepID=UPI003B5CF657
MGLIWGNGRFHAKLLGSCYNPATMESSGQNRRQLWVGIGVSVLSIALILLLIDPAEIVDSLRQAEISLIGWSALAILAFMIFRAVRWRYMLTNDISWSQTFHIQNIGYMFNMVLPFRLGDVARAVLIGNVPPITLARGLSTMVVERILDMMFIVALLPFTLVEVVGLPPLLQDAARSFGIVAITAIIALVIAANQRKLATRWGTAVLNHIPFLSTERWIGRMNELLDGLGSLTRLKDSLVLVFLSIVVWIPIVFAYRWGILAVGGEATLLGASFVVCAAALSIALPSSPGQIGVFHIGVTAAMLALGQSNGAAGGFAVVYHALNLISMVILGLIGLASTGATFGSVIETTQRFIRRRQLEEDSDLSKVEG